MRRFTSLIALSALTATAALAPAHAMAVANNPSAGECRAPGAGDTVVLIGGQLCAANQGSGGNAGTGTGALPGGRQPGEVVWVTGEIPVCLRNPARCLPGQIGGRGGRQEIGDGPGSGGPSGGGKRSAGSGKTETAKGTTAKQPTLKDCEKTREIVDEWNAQMAGLGWYEREIGELRFWIGKRRFWMLGILRPIPSAPPDYSQMRAYRNQVLRVISLENYLEQLEGEKKQTLEKLEAIKARMEGGLDGLAAAVKVCRKLYFH